MSGLTASLLLVSVASAQAELKLTLNQAALDRLNSSLSESNFIIEIIAANMKDNQIRFIDYKPFFKSLQLAGAVLALETTLTISNLQDGVDNVLEFHMKSTSGTSVELYSQSISVRSHSLPSAPTIQSVTSGNNGISIKLNTIGENTLADGFMPLSKVYFVLLNVSTGSARDIQVASLPFVYGTGLTQSYELRNSLELSILNDQKYDVCAYCENGEQERGPLSTTFNVLVSPNPNEVKNFAALVNDASLCIALSWNAPDGTYTAPPTIAPAPAAPMYAGAFTNDSGVLDVTSIIDFYYITRVCDDTSLNITVSVPLTSNASFTYNDSDSLVAGKNYVYSIIAHNGHGNGTAAPLNAPLVQQIYYTKPLPSTVVTVNPIPDRVSELKVTWMVPIDFSTNGCINKAYVLQRYSVDASNVSTIDNSFIPEIDGSYNLVFTTVSVSNVIVNEYIDMTATINTKYKYAVYVKCDKPNSPYVQLNSGLTFSNAATGMEPPSSPVNLGATAGDKKITYTWDKPLVDSWDDDLASNTNTDLIIAGYALVIGTSPAIFIEASGNSYTHPVSGLTNGTSYTAKVSAYVKSGSDYTKVYSRPATFPGPQMPYGPASAITTLVCTSSTTENVMNTLTWDGSLNLLLNGGEFVSYRISRTGGPVLAPAFTPVNLTNNLLKTYVDSSANLGITYTYTFAIITKDAKFNSNSVVGAGKTVSGMPISQPRIHDVVINGANLDVLFYQNGSQVTSMLAVGVDSSSSNNMVKQVTNIDIPLGPTNELQTISVVLGSAATNGGLVVIGNTLGFAYDVLAGNPPVMLNGSTSNAVSTFL